MKIFYALNLKKEYINLIESFIKKYKIDKEYKIIICETKRKDIYGETISYGNESLMKINFSLGEVEDTFVHELAHIISNNIHHTLSWRRAYRKLKGKEIINGR